MSVTIRHAEPGDAEEIVRMIDALSAALDDPPTPLTPEDIRRDGFGPAPWFVCFLAEQNGRAVGYALAYPGFSTDHGGRGLHLADLYVEESARGQAIGRALMASVARHGRELGAVWLAWDVWVENDAARAFYEALGAEAHPEVDVMALTGDALEALARSGG